MTEHHRDHPGTSPRHGSVSVLLLCLLALNAGSCGGPSRTTGTTERVVQPPPVEQLTVQGLTRTVRYHVPSRLSERPALIVVLHGGGGDGERFRRLTNGAFDALADEYGFIVAYPDGLGGRWHDCRSRAPYREALAGVDEGAFLRAVVRRGEEILGGRRPAGVFLVGYSNGGHLVFRIALETPAAFDAYAAIGANLPAQEERTCRTSGEGMSIMLVNGTEDPISPWEGGRVRAPGGTELGSVLSAGATAAHFVELASASAASRDVDGAGEIWKFFARHRPAVDDAIDSR